MAFSLVRGKGSHSLRPGCRILRYIIKTDWYEVIPKVTNGLSFCFSEMHFLKYFFQQMLKRMLFFLCQDSKMNNVAKHPRLLMGVSEGNGNTICKSIKAPTEASSRIVRRFCQHYEFAKYRLLNMFTTYELYRSYFIYNTGWWCSYYTYLRMNFVTSWSDPDIWAYASSILP